ncbi:hypothetical protein HanXRQr2_Chr05g0195691 [Helianthus annuus]|uniref:Uncharacterized protein n=1 Tax=Helianthus annuus TaxID=4232 RepID=A0A9K3IWL3_HELAN|nr:hypothetical protein HanXRQr2_Chr05g0195691 [Helianthus annuus]
MHGVVAIRGLAALGGLEGENAPLPSVLGENMNNEKHHYLIKPISWVGLFHPRNLRVPLIRVKGH